MELEVADVPRPAFAASSSAPAAGQDQGPPALQPALQLPEELLVQIFEALLLPDRLAAAGVCAVWRAAALKPGEPLVLAVVADARSRKLDHHDQEPQCVPAYVIKRPRTVPAFALPVETAAALLRCLRPAFRDAATELRLTVFFAREDFDVKGGRFCLPALVCELPPSIASLALRLPAAPKFEVGAGHVLEALGPSLAGRLPRLASVSLADPDPDPGEFGKCTPDQLGALPGLRRLQACVHISELAAAHDFLTACPALRRVSKLCVRSRAASAGGLQILARGGLRCRGMKLAALGTRSVDLRAGDLLAALCAVLRPAEFGPQDGSAKLVLKDCALPSALPAGALDGLESLVLHGSLENVTGLSSFWGIPSLTDVDLSDTSLRPGTPATADALLAALEGTPARISPSVEIVSSADPWPAAVLLHFLRRLASHPLRRRLGLLYYPDICGYSDAERRDIKAAFDRL